jgi:hypothetical protein
MMMFLAYSFLCPSRVLSNDLLFEFALLFYFVKENIWHSVFLCINGGALTIARVPTRSFQTLLPSIWVDYEEKHGNRWMWRFNPKLSNPSATDFIVPFWVYKSIFCFVNFLMYYHDGWMQVCPLHSAGSSLYSTRQRYSGSKKNTSSTC